MECTQSKVSAPPAGLLLCSGPMKCHSMVEPVDAGNLVDAFLHVVLAESTLAAAAASSTSGQRPGLADG